MGKGRRRVCDISASGKLLRACSGASSASLTSVHGPDRLVVFARQCHHAGTAASTAASAHTMTRINQIVDDLLGKGTETSIHKYAKAYQATSPSSAWTTKAVKIGSNMTSGRTARLHSGHSTGFLAERALVAQSPELLQYPRSGRPDAADRDSSGARDLSVGLGVVGK